MSTRREGAARPKPKRDAKAAERFRKAAEKVARDEAKREAKKRENPREVAEYLELCRTFRAGLKDAIGAAHYGKFSPEAQRFVGRWHDDLREKLDQLESAWASERGGNGI